jgi:hypothetical protein
MPAVGKHYIPSYTIQKFPWDANFHTFQWHGPSPKSPQEVGRINYVPVTAVQRFDMEKNFIRNGASRHCREDGGINSVWNRRPQDGRIGAKTSITITWTNQNLIVWFVWLSSWPICAAAISESMSSQTMTLKNPKVLVFGAGGKIHPKCLVLEWFGTSNQADFWQPGILGPHLLGIWGQLPLDRGSEAIGIWFRGAGPRALTGAPLAVTKILHKSLELTVDRRLCLIASIGQFESIPNNVITTPLLWSNGGNPDMNIS